MIEAVKAERIVICLFTDSKGRQHVGAASYEAGRSTGAILDEAIRAIEADDGQIIDLDFPKG